MLTREEFIKFSSTSIYFIKVTYRTTYYTFQIIVYSSLTVLKGVIIRERRLLQNTFPAGVGGGEGERCPGNTSRYSLDP